LAKYRVKDLDIGLGLCP